MNLPILPSSWTQGPRDLPVIINLFGGPGIGKTTMAARLFVALKIKGLETANPEEHAKLALWKGRPNILDQQLIILGQSWETLHALIGNVDVIVMDSPLLLCSVYGAKEKSHFHETVVDFHQRLPRLNVLLQRPKDHSYSDRGRRETQAEAQDIDTRVMDALEKWEESYIKVETCAQSAEDIAQNIASWHADRFPF